MKLFPIIRPPIPDEWLNLDLTMLQFKVLLLLYMNGSMRVGEIALRARISIAAMTGLADRLVKKGLMEREHSDKDRRVIVCSLTDDGRYWVGQLWNSSKSRWELIMERMSLRDLAIFYKALQVIYKATEGINWDTNV